jgi:hypothetical protein
MAAFELEHHPFDVFVILQFLRSHQQGSGSSFTAASGEVNQA